MMFAVSAVFIPISQNDREIYCFPLLGRARGRSWILNGRSMAEVTARPIMITRSYREQRPEEMKTEMEVSKRRLFRRAGEASRVQSPLKVSFDFCGRCHANPSRSTISFSKDFQRHRLSPPAYHKVAEAGLANGSNVSRIYSTAEHEWNVGNRLRLLKRNPSFLISWKERRVTKCRNQD